MLKTRTPVTVLPAHTDTLGHLNHVQAVAYLELARDDWYQASGLWDGRPSSTAETLATVVVNINVNYRAECFEGDILTVSTFALGHGSKSFTLGQEIHRADGTLAVQGQAVSVIMDLTGRRTLPVRASVLRHMP